MDAIYETRVSICVHDLGLFWSNVISTNKRVIQNIRLINK